MADSSMTWHFQHLPSMREALGQTSSSVREGKKERVAGRKRRKANKGEPPESCLPILWEGYNEKMPLGMGKPAARWRATAASTSAFSDPRTRRNKLVLFL